MTCQCSNQKEFIFYPLEQGDRIDDMPMLQSKGVYLLSIRTRIKTTYTLPAWQSVLLFIFYPLEQGLRQIFKAVRINSLRVYLLSIRTRIKTLGKLRFLLHFTVYLLSIRTRIKTSIFLYPLIKSYGVYLLSIRTRTSWCSATSMPEKSLSFIH